MRDGNPFYGLVFHREFSRSQKRRATFSGPSGTWIFVPPEDAESFLPFEEGKSLIPSATIKRWAHIRPRREPEDRPSRQGWGSLRWTRVAWLGPVAFARFIGCLPVEGLRIIVS